MRKLIAFLCVFITVASFALPVAARSLILQPSNAFQDQCTPEAKDALYQSFRNSFQTDLAKAYEAAKKYIACPEPPYLPEDQKRIINYFKRWSAAYEEALRKTRLQQLLHNEKKYPEAYALGKEILASEPENLKVLIDLGANCHIVAQQNPQLTAGCIEYATKALRLLESGETLDDWSPFGSKDGVIAYLNYSIGALTVETEPANAVKHLLKAAQLETPLKKSPYTYAFIAQAYEAGPYTKQSEAYKWHSGPPEGPETRLALANINQLVDRMIDALARAVALAGDDPKFAKSKAIWMESLTNFYNYRHPDGGMNELIKGILSKPLQPEPTPLTSLPPATTTPKPE